MTDAVTEQIAALRDQDWAIRGEAAGLLGSFKDPRAVTPLVSLLRDQDRSVREAAIEALRSIGAPAVEAVGACLTEPDLSVQESASAILATIADERVLVPLITALRSNDWIVRRTGRVWAGPTPTAFNERVRPHRDADHRTLRRQHGEDNRMSRGSKSTIKSVRPGIMPPLFGQPPDRQGRVPGPERGRRQPAAAGGGVHPGSHGRGAGGGLPAGSRSAAGGSHQGDDEAPGPAAPGHDAANAAGLSGLSVRLGAGRLLEAGAMAAGSS